MYRLTGLLVMAATALAATALAGCAILGANVTQGLTSSGCTNISGGACQEQLDRAAARHPNATTVDVTCTIPACDRKGGAGTVVVTLANGAKVNETFSYSGDPGPIPAPSCSGMALDVCRNLATSTVDNLPPSKAIRTISIACTASSCTRDRGQADVRVQFADGGEFKTNSGWEGGLP